VRATLRGKHLRRCGLGASRLHVRSVVPPALERDLPSAADAHAAGLTYRAEAQDAWCHGGCRAGERTGRRGRRKGRAEGERGARKCAPAFAPSTPTDRIGLAAAGSKGLLGNSERKACASALLRGSSGRRSGASPLIAKA